jgi:hypothetical protein
MEQYLSVYNRAIDMNVIAGPDPQGFRRINVRNNNTNASDTLGGWTVEATDRIILSWNSEYPTCGLTTVAFPQYDTWTCEGTFTTGQAIEFNDTIIEQGLQLMDKRKLWYMEEAFMTFIENSGGSASGTGQNVDNNMRDSRLD